jgi:hypothetical protein
MKTMRKSSVLLMGSVIFLCISQWGSSVWLANSIKSNDPLPIVNLDPNDVSSPTPPAYDKGINVERLEATIERIVQQQAQLALEKYSDSLIARQIEENKHNTIATKTNIANINTQDTLSDAETSDEQNEASQEDFSAAMDIVSAAVLNYDWDESTSNQLSSYKDKLTDKQRNEIVGEYVKAFQDGLVNPSVNPPF